MRNARETEDPRRGGAAALRPAELSSVTGRPIIIAIGRESDDDNLICREVGIETLGGRGTV